MIETQEYLSRREELISKLAENSVLVLASGQPKVRSKDTEYPFCQNKNFYYLTGFNEPNGVLILTNRSSLPTATLFCSPKDDFMEIWHGRRLGPEQAQTNLGFAATFSIDELSKQLPIYLDHCEHLYFSQGLQPQLDQSLFTTCNTLRNAPRQSRQAPKSFVDSRDLIHEMRLFKSEAEAKVMKKAADISMKAHERAMKFTQPGKFEYQLQAELEHEFLMQGARAPAYGTIVGSGENGCILHYTENADVLNAGDLILIDAGAEFEGYAADITRTFPVSGKFSQAQRALYQIVLDAQLAALEHIKPGVNFKVASDVAIKVITQGLLDLEILNGSLEDCISLELYRQFYMHGLGHWLGLDVHDQGNYKVDGQDRLLEAGMVLTIEPGIYISPKANVDDKWKGIGIRIEDDVLVTNDGHENLTAKLPKTIHDIEALMASIDS